jgi:hypothetical protein
MDGFPNILDPALARLGGIEPTKVGDRAPQQVSCKLLGGQPLA